MLLSFNNFNSTLYSFLVNAVFWEYLYKSIAICKTTTNQHNKYTLLQYILDSLQKKIVLERQIMLLEGC